jgi:hypothetical protein
MTKLILLLSLSLLIAGCNKSSNVKPIVLTGSYVSYREVDTVYNAFNVADGIEYISIYSASGDSLYNYPGTASANNYFGPHSTNPGNAAAEGLITITFNSSNTATETEPSFVPTYITYNLKAGTFSDGLINVRERIIAINANTIELITNPTSVDNQPNTTGFMQAIYYRSQ